MSENMMNCARCDELFADYFEGTLPDDVRDDFHNHVSTCARCQGLVRDIEGIRVDAGNLPELVPPRDLWSGIEARIQPEVVSIASRPAAQVSKRWLAAAAAALIVATSGVTYVATMRSLATSSASLKTPIAAVPPAVAMAKPELSSIEPGASSGGANAQGAPAAAVHSASRGENREPTVRTPRTSLASATSRSSVVPTASEIAFAGEINQLQTVLDQRRSQLDPETVKVVEDNLKLIDTAASRARAALAKDPASAFLMRQLDGVLQKKVELLRTVALLPAST
jgi:putative zinc finger protein